MGLYLRKSFKLGPVRLNLSKSGLGTSFGVKGARLGVSPRGVYVHGGRKGLYYRSRFYRPGRGAGRTKGRASHHRATAPSGAASSDAPSAAQSQPAPPVERLPAVRGDIDDTLMRELALRAHRIALMPPVVAGGAVPTLALLVLAVARHPFYYAFPAVAAIATVVGGVVASAMDHKRRDLELRYDLSPDLDAAYARLRDAAGAIVPARAFRLSHETEIHLEDGRSLPSHEGDLFVTSHTLGARFTSNVEIIGLVSDAERLFFLPDRLFVARAAGTAAIRYGSLALACEAREQAIFGPGPSAAEVVRTTWEHVRKDGEPDHRYKGNAEIKVARLFVLRLEDAGTGFSSNIASPNRAALETLHACLERMKPVKTAEIPDPDPTDQFIGIRAALG